MNKCTAISILAIFASSFAMSPVSIAASNVSCSFKQVSKRIYVIVGSDHKTCPEDEVKHPVTNPSVIVGDSGVIVIDPGSSLQVGRLVLERLKRITNKPVVAVFNTHIHGLYWLGNQAIKERFPDARIYAHKRMIERIDSGEGAFWVNAITGKFPGEKTKYVVPDVPLSGGEVKVISGVSLKLHHPGLAHTDHDIMIEVPEEQTVFLGGVVVEPEVPSQGVPQDAEFQGQIAATRFAIGLGADKYVPGRGHFEITERLKADLSGYKQWYDFGKLGGVVSQMYLQIESASF
jgi:glyoxylase-like metal-dependent hydrolase (beta-lactamase superfamily II)